MRRGLTIAFFGSSLVSAYWNGAATYYRGSWTSRGRLTMVRIGGVKRKPTLVGVTV
jgi:hypothetical protein